MRVCGWESAVYSVINREPARDDCGRLATEQWVDVDVDFANGIVGTVCVMIQHRDLQRFILQVFIIHLFSHTHTHTHTHTQL